MTARTDRNHVCIQCLARQARLDACVRCGSEILLDLSDATNRHQLVRELGERGQRTRYNRVAAIQSSEMLVVALGVAVPFLCLVLGWFVHSGMVLGVSLVLFVLCGLAIKKFRARSQSAQNAINEHPGRLWPKLEIIDRTRAESQPLPERTDHITGYIRATRSFPSPIHSTPCIAVVLHGTTDAGALNDASVTTFTLVDEQQQIIARFEGGSAVVDVKIPYVSGVAHRPTGALRDFIDARIELGQEDEVTVNETVLTDGECVSLEGPCTEETEASGYRGSRSVKIFRGTALQPVTLSSSTTAQVRVIDTDNFAEENAVSPQVSTQRRLGGDR
jgi:hypothetical protein